MQYTVRNIPKTLDDELRRRAREQGKSLNEVTVEAMVRGVGHAAEPIRCRDLSDIAGTWKRDAAVEEALAAQDQIDQAVWE